MASHSDLSNFIWQIADLLRGPYRPPQYERVMLPMTVLRRFDCVLAATKAKVLAEHERRKGGRLNDDALDRMLNNAAGQRFHNHSPLDFEKLKGDPDNIAQHLVGYIKGFSANVRTIFDFFEFEGEIEKMREANLLFLVVSKFCDVDLHPNAVPNEQMGLIFENLIRRFNELANETAGDHFTPREIIRLDVRLSAGQPAFRRRLEKAAEGHPARTRQARLCRSLRRRAATGQRRLAPVLAAHGPQVRAGAAGPTQARLAFGYRLQRLAAVRRRRGLRRERHP
jgi:type I restriction-modification system DNA methylase subunit